MKGGRTTRGSRLRAHVRVRVIVGILLAGVAWLALEGALLAPAATAASATIAISADSPPPPPVPSGQASGYTINFTCSAVLGSTCGRNPTITIPLDLTSSNPATPDMSTWAYGASSSISGLVDERERRRRELRDPPQRVGTASRGLGYGQRQRHAAEQHHARSDDLVAEALVPDRPDLPGGGPVGGAGRRERHGPDLGLKDDQRRRRRVRPRQQRRLHDRRPLQPGQRQGESVPHRRQPRRHAAQRPDLCVGDARAHERARGRLERDGHLELPGQRVAAERLLGEGGGRDDLSARRGDRPAHSGQYVPDQQRHLQRHTHRHVDPDVDDGHAQRHRDRHLAL